MSQAPSALEQQLVDDGYRARVGGPDGMTLKQLREMERYYIKVCLDTSRKQTAERADLVKYHGVEAAERRKYAEDHGEMPAMSKEYQMGSDKMKTTMTKMAKEAAELKAWTAIREKHQDALAAIFDRKVARGESLTNEERNFGALFVFGREYSVGEETMTGQFAVENGAVTKSFGATTTFELPKAELDDPAARVSETAAAYTMLQMSKNVA
jgi:hypothetical protein